MYEPNYVYRLYHRDLYEFVLSYFITFLFELHSNVFENVEIL
jgi:hypothetical protein